jgi:hypothetical protein
MSVLDQNPGIGIHSKHVARVRLRYSLFPAYLYVCRRISLSFSRDYSDSRLIVSVESESSLVRLVDEISAASRTAASCIRCSASLQAFGQFRFALSVGLVGISQ